MALEFIFDRLSLTSVAAAVLPVSALYLLPWLFRQRPGWGMPLGLQCTAAAFVSYCVVELLLASDPVWKQSGWHNTVELSSHFSASIFVLGAAYWTRRIPEIKQWYRDRGCAEKSPRAL